MRLKFISFLLIIYCSYINRHISYEGADVILCCFALNDPISLKNIRTKWMPEIREHSPDAPVVICGTKSDLGDIISTEAVEKVVADTGSISYVFCSALTGRNLNKVFDEAIKVYLAAKAKTTNTRTKKSTTCLSVKGLKAIFQSCK